MKSFGMAAGALALATTTASAITYTVDLTDIGGSTLDVTGTIETDGTIGTGLGFDIITGFNLTVSFDVGQSFVLDTSNGANRFDEQGTPFNVTATTFDWDFSNDGARWVVTTQGFGELLQFCNNLTDQNCATSPALGSNTGIGASTNFGTPEEFAAFTAAETLSFGDNSGNGGPVVGTIPLPAALPLLLAGLAGIGIVARRRA
ncbi:MAG: VPLPA-CTERM sorting domain-containing protein [Paracoccaceae bacterium]